MDSAKKLRWAKLNQKITKITEYIAYLAAVSMIIIALLAFINVVTSKLFRWSIPENINWIGYLIVPAVYLAVPNVQLSRGLTNVDLFSRKFPMTVQKIISTLAMILGAGIYGYSAYRSYFLFHDYYVYREMSAQSKNAFVLWPFVVVFGIGTILLTLSFLWKIPCIWILGDPREDLPAEANALPTELEEGSKKDD